MGRGCACELVTAREILSLRVKACEHDRKAHRGKAAGWVRLVRCSREGVRCTIHCQLSPAAWQGDNSNNNNHKNVMHSVPRFKLRVKTVCGWEANAILTGTRVYRQCPIPLETAPPSPTGCKVSGDEHQAFRRTESTITHATHASRAFPFLQQTCFKHQPH